MSFYIDHPHHKKLFENLATHLDSNLVYLSSGAPLAAHESTQDKFLQEIEQRYIQFIEAKYAGGMLSIKQRLKKWQRVGSNSNSIQRKFRRRKIRTQFRQWVHLLQNSEDDFMAAWCPVKPNRYLVFQAAKYCGKSLLYFEDAPWPGFIVCDNTGINAGSSIPKSAKFYKDWFTKNKETANKIAIKNLFEKLPQREPSKDLKNDALELETLDWEKKIIYCPLQVPDDTQILLYGDWIYSVQQFIKLIYNASRHLPDGWQVAVREHPSSTISFTMILNKLVDDRFAVFNQGTSKELLMKCSAVVTINSSVGFHAFFCDKPVITLGDSLWGFEPVAQLVKNAEALNHAFKSIEASYYCKESRTAFLYYLFSEVFLYKTELEDIDNPNAPQLEPIKRNILLSKNT